MPPFLSTPAKVRVPHDRRLDASIPYQDTGQYYTLLQPALDTHCSSSSFLPKPSKVLFFRNKGKAISSILCRKNCRSEITPCHL